jgi:hypothetical protein
MPNEVLRSFYALEGVEVTNCHATHMLWAKYDVARDVPIDAHFIQRGAYNWALDGFALGEGEMCGCESVSDARMILSVVCSMVASYLCILLCLIPPANSLALAFSTLLKIAPNKKMVQIQYLMYAKQHAIWTVFVRVYFHHGAFCDLFEHKISAQAISRLDQQRHVPCSFKL